MPRLSKGEHQRRLRLYREGLTDKELAERVGVSKQAVCQWRKKQGLPPHKNKWQALTKDEEKERLRLYKAGLTDQEIGAEVGISGAAVYHWRNERGLKRNRGVPQSEHEKRLHLYNQGLSDQEIADRVYTTKSAIYQWRKQHDLEANYSIGAKPGNNQGGNYLDEEEEKRRITLYRRGLTDREIAEVVGISPGGVYKWRRKRCLPDNEGLPVTNWYDERYSEPELEEFLESVRENGSLRWKEGKDDT